MSELEKKLMCVVDQLRQERETIKTLEGLNLNDGRKDQIIEKRLAQVRRNHGMTLDDSIRIR